MEKALQGRQKYLKASIFRPLQGSVKTTPYPQGLRPGLEIYRPLRGCVVRSNGVLQQSQNFRPYSHRSATIGSIRVARRAGK